MRVLRVQLLLMFPLLLWGCGAHLLLDGPPDLRGNWFGRPPVPQPLQFPPPHYSQYQPPLVHHPLVYRVPHPHPQPQQVLVLRQVFPPFIERIVQRIQTYWSVYTPTTPPTLDPEYTTTYRPPNKKVTTTTTTTTTTPPPTTTEEQETTEDAEHATTAPPAEDTTTKVSTLAVFEVTPSSSPEPPGETTMAPDPEADTEEPVFITPEKASLIGQKEAFLRFLKTGKVPPYLESDTLNEMDDIFS